jgi:hypothetical protein
MTIDKIQMHLKDIYVRVGSLGGPTVLNMKEMAALIDVLEVLRQYQKLSSKDTPMKAHYVHDQDTILDQNGLVVETQDISFYECPVCHTELEFWNYDGHCAECGQWVKGADCD